MRKLIYIFLIGLIVISSCSSVKTLQSTQSRQPELKPAVPQSKKEQRTGILIVVLFGVLMFQYVDSQH